MSTAFGTADILLPQDVDFTKWACIACDQFTSEPEYWDEARKAAGDCVTTLDLILPEVYLDKPDCEKRIAKITANMYGYLDSDVFEEYRDALIYVERTQTDGIIRAGIVGAIDLEQYDYSVGSTSQVRATEATVPERIPPRLKVREDAPIELPHIMILIDDVMKTVIEPLAAKKDDMKKLYSFELMLGGGKVEGWLVDKSDKQRIFDALDALADKDSFNERYGLNDAQPLVYAMGDGNHSLATAKVAYEKLKAQNPDKDYSNHPARYALAEIVNLHSPALNFEAIHRIVTDIDKADFIERLTDTLGLNEDGNGEQRITIVNDGEQKEYFISNPSSKLAVGSLQSFLGDYTSKFGGKVDYIHGEETVRRLAQGDTLGFILPDMEKSELFPTVIADGALPRKTFSMGHAKDKRYYIEARKIK